MINWSKTKQYFEKNFGEEIDLDGILFIIGVHELGKGSQKFSKDQKLDILHIAVCTLLEPYHYYSFKGYDDDGWPHWERTDKLPNLRPREQEELMKTAIIEYVVSNNLITLDDEPVHGG